MTYHDPFNNDLVLDTIATPAAVMGRFTESRRSISIATTRSPSSLYSPPRKPLIVRTHGTLRQLGCWWNLRYLQESDRPQER